MTTVNNHINYVEFKAKDLVEIKNFYSKVFGWAFTDYGPNYISFTESGLARGFERSETEIVNGGLIVIAHRDLNAAKNDVI